MSDIDQRIERLRERYGDVAGYGDSDVIDICAELERLRAMTCALSHVVILSGFIPGIDYRCRCEECLMVAKKLDAAGYVADEHRWWITAPLP